MKSAGPAAVRAATNRAGGQFHRMWNALRGYRLYLALISVAGLLLRYFVPANIVWQSPHDEEAAMRIAAALMQGDWFGEWGAQPVSHITLAKGPGYPIFLALTHWTGIAPQNLCYVIYLLGALLLVLALKSLVSRGAIVALYALLAWSPVAFAADFSHIYRDQLVAALALLSVGLSARLVTALTGSQHRAGALRRWLSLAAQASSLGVALGWLLITRSDVVWVITTVVIVLVAGVAPVVRHSRPRAWGAPGLSLALIAGFAMLPTVGVVQMNQRTYQVALLEDFSQGAFADAIKSWSSVPGGEDFLVVSDDQREAVYAVSSTARLLEPFLEAPGNTWVAHGCSFQTDTYVPCDEFGGSFSWALRDAAMATGEIRTAAEFQQFFQRLDDEIVTACSSQVLACGARAISPDVPSLDRISIRTFVAGFAGYAAGSLSGGANAWSQAGPPSSSSDSLEMWLTTVNGSRQTLDLVESGQHQAILTQRGIVQALGSIYGWWLIPALLLSIVALFTRALWTSFIGRVALACFMGWGMNLAIVALFHAGTNKFGGSGLVIYTMSSQSFFLLGTALAALIVAQAGWQNRLAGPSSVTAIRDRHSAQHRNRDDGRPVS